MNKLFYLSTLFFAIILFSGCPYSSEVAIDASPKIKVDKSLLGKYELRSSTDYIYKVTSVDDYTYHIEKKSKTDGEPENYKGFISEIEGVKFFNIYEDKDDAEMKYYFYKLDAPPGTSLFTMLPVTENIDETFTSSEELKKFFKANMNLSFFYAKDEESYIKTGN